MSTHIPTRFLAPRNWPVAVWLLIVGLSSLFLNWCSLAAPTAKSPECATVVVTEYRSVGTSRVKKGFSTFSVTTPPEIYQVRITSEEASSADYPINAANSYSALIAAPGNLRANPVTVAGSASVNFRRLTSGLSLVETYDTQNLTDTSHTDSNRHITNSAQVYGIQASGGTSFSGWISYVPDALNGTETMTFLQNCTSNTTTANGGLVITVGTLGNVVSTTQATTNSPSGYTPALRRYNLSSLYDTATLLADAADDLQVTPGWGQHSAYNQCTTSHSTSPQPSPLAVRTLETDERSVLLQRAEYRFVFSTDKGTSYLVTWDEKTSLVGTVPTYIHKRLQVPGTGSKYASAAYELTPPLANGTRRIVNVKVMPIDGCGDCGPETEISGRREPGSGTVGLNDGVAFSMDLGKGAFGFPAGSLWIAQERPSASLATRAALNFSGDTNIVQVAYDGTQISRVVSHQMVADVIPTSYAFTINCYAISNGVHLTNEAPIGTWAFSNPDASSTVTNRYRIVQTAPSLNVTNDFNWNNGASKWTLSVGNGLRTNTQQTSWDIAYTNRTEAYETWNADGSLAVKRTRLFAIFPWGEGLVQEILDPAGVALTNIWTYDPQGRVETLTRTDGFWEKFTYRVVGGNSNLVSTRMIPFLNLPATPANPSSDVNELTTYLSSPADGAPDDPTIDPESPRRVEENVNNSRIRTYNIFLPGERRVIDVPGISSTAWDAAENVVTRIKYYTNGTFTNFIRSIHFPNLTVQLFTYSESSEFRTNTIYAGRYDSNLDLVVDGTKTVIVMDKTGQSRSKLSTDILSSNTIDAETTTVDKLGRPVQVDYLDGRSDFMSYAPCCGVEFLTNRAGSVVKYEYDSLKRVTAERQYRSGLTLSTLFSYDAANRIKTVARVGTNGTSLVLRSFTYDGLGRLIGETNAVGVVTAYSYVWDGNGQTVKRTTYASGTGDEAVRVETFARDGSFLSVTGSAVFPFKDTYPENTQVHVRRTALNADGTDSMPFRATKLDGARRLIGVHSPVSDGNGELVYSYNGLNQLTRFRSPEGLRFYSYNGRGEVETNAVDMDLSESIVPAGTDRIVMTTNDVVVDGSIAFFRSRTYAWPTLNNASSILLTTREVSVDKLLTRETSFGLTNKELLAYLGNGEVQLVYTGPDNASVTSVFQDGRLVTQISQDSSPDVLHTVAFAYDEFDRRTSMHDSRNGTTTFVFDDEDRTTSVTTPVPSAGLSAQTTQFVYDNRGRVIRTVYPDGASSTNTYTGTGQLKSQSGVRMFTVEYSYDAQGRLVTNTTWNAGVPQQVFYRYEPQLGLLAAKQYSDGTSNTFTYANSSQLHKNRISRKTNARGTNTTYSYSAAGEIIKIEYSNTNTLTTLFEYDRLGRMIRTQQGSGGTAGSGTNWFNFAPSGALIGESNQLFKIGVANTYDSLLRRTAQSFVSNATVLASTSYGYDGASRITGTTNGAYSSVVSYVALAPEQVESIVNRLNSTIQHTVTRTYDFLDRVTKISSKPSAVPALPFTYTYNNANQRTNTALQDASYWNYQYDALGQLNSAKRYWSAGNPVPGQQFEYVHDELGNRTSTSAGGDSVGGNLRTFSYAANQLGQYTSRTNPGTFDVLGLANNLATVSVNGTNGVYRHGEYFHKELSANNTASAANALVTNQAVLVTTTNQLGSYLLDRTNVVLSYDADGNLTNDGRWAYSWDAENRLKSMVSSANVPFANQIKLEFLYDAFGRRVQKTFATNNGIVYVNQYTNHYLYDGELIVAEADQASRLLRSYVWGQGTDTQLATLIGIIDHTNNASHFATTDASGHVAELVSGSSGTPTARYEYAPFGEPIRSSGSFASVNPIRFAGQYTDIETGLSVFRHRLLNPSTGRWLQRDPMDEIDGPNLYAYVNNDPVNGSDPLGLWNLWSPATWGVGGGGYSLGDRLNPNGESAHWDVYQLDPEALIKGFNAAVLNRFDPCDPDARLSAAVGSASKAVLLALGPGGLAKWGARGGSLLRVLASEGAIAADLAIAGLSIDNGIQEIQAGNSVNGLLELAGGLGGIGTSLRSFGAPSRGYLAAQKAAANRGRTTLAGHFEYVIADGGRATQVQNALVRYYNRHADNPGIDIVQGLGGARIDTVSARIQLGSDVVERFPHLIDGYVTEELFHFHQIHTRGILGRELIGNEGRVLEDEVVGRMLRSGFRKLE